MGGWLSYAVLALFALVAANLPFLSERILFFLDPRRKPKAFAWRLFELVLMYFAVGLFARLLESRQGEIYPQGWEFYAATACLFAVLAYPGYVWRYLWRKKN